MAQSMSLETVKERLQVQSDGDAANSFNLSGQNPMELMKHTIGKEYIILGMTPEDFIKERGAQSFDFQELVKDFKKICFDYEDQLEKETPSKAVEFCSKIIYEVGPESRGVKKATGDKVWKFKFCYAIEKKLVVKTAFVCTYKADDAEYKPTTEDNKIVLSIKQAGLLSMLTFTRLIHFGCSLKEPVYLLTPLCGAIFSRMDIDAMSIEMKVSAKVILQKINSSAQSGGHYLPDSDLGCAVVCSIISTQGLANKGKHSERKSIITKIIKQYMAVKKEWLEDCFVIYARYANGGLQTGMDAKAMIDFFKSCQRSEFNPIPVRKAIGAADETEIKTLIDNIGNKAIVGKVVDLTYKDGTKKTQVKYVPPPPTAKDVRNFQKRRRGEDDDRDKDED